MTCANADTPATYLVQTAAEEAVLRLINEQRAANGVPALTLNLKCKEQGEWELEIDEQSSGADTEGFIVLPHRWIVERTLGWLMRNRRLSKDYEQQVQTYSRTLAHKRAGLCLRVLGNSRADMEHCGGAAIGAS